jgi:hypothetical protein
VAATRGHSPLAHGTAASAHPRWSLTQVRSIRNEPASGPADSPGRPVMDGSAELEGLSAAVRDGDGRASPPGAMASDFPPQPAEPITTPDTASSSHPRLIPRRRPDSYAGCNAGRSPSSPGCRTRT